MLMVFDDKVVFSQQVHLKLFNAFSGKKEMHTSYMQKALLALIVDLLFLS